MDILRFVFRGFWTFLGCFLLLGLTVDSVVRLIEAVMRPGCAAP